MSTSCCGTDKKENSGPENNVNVSKAQKSVFKVSGMDCADEVQAVQEKLKIDGVIKVEANLMNESVSVYHSKEVSQETIVTQILKAGLKVVKEEKRDFFHDNTKRIALIVFSGTTLSIGLIFDYLEAPAYIGILLFALSMLAASIIILPKAFRSIMSFRLDMNVLMTVAVVGAILIKEYSEAASVIFLFSLAELLEAMSVARARKAIQEVLKITPKEALLIKDNKTVRVAVEEIKVGDVILARPGDSLAIDGKVVDGSSLLNEASLTGESRPVEKNVGDQVLAGSINESGALKIEVTKPFSDSKISQIMNLIESAQNDKAPSQRFVDKFASIYTPSVLVLAIFIAFLPPILGAGDWNTWVYRALVFLVIGCPCALVIATPVSVVSGLTSLAKKGILVKGGVHLESLGKLKAIALDKTGTLTEGKPKVVAMKVFSGNESEIISIAASLESLTTHPLALAVLDYAKKSNTEIVHPSNFKAISGKGAQGDLGGHTYFVGNHKLAHEMGICTPEIEKYLEEAEAKSLSVIVVGHVPHDGCKGEIFAIFTLGDKIREGVQQVVTEFHRAGVVQVTVLSGDNKATVDAVAKSVGVDDWHGGLLPEDKVEQIKKMMSKYHFVGMVGDGVNDAPALATASIGIAMGVVGSDTTIETADVALMKDDLHMLPKAVLQGKRVLGVIRFNIAFAIMIKVVFFILAIFGKTNLWLAVAADMGASLVVTFNALRLLKVKD